MQTLNGSTGSQAEVDELAKMSYHLGVSVDMDYNTDGSGALLALYAQTKSIDAACKFGAKRCSGKPES